MCVVAIEISGVGNSVSLSQLSEVKSVALQ
jgi:hypothetical protein